nr:diffuse panbronchiolitis critical region protein 1 [Loxodonta africana]
MDMELVLLLLGLQALASHGVSTVSGDISGGLSTDSEGVPRISTNLPTLLTCLSLSTGATTLQELRKTGESPTSDPLFLLTSSLVYSPTPDHTAPDSGHSPPGLPKSTETHKPKHHCNTTHHSRPIHKPIENPKIADHKSSTTHHEVPPTSEQNPRNQGKDRNRRSIESSDSRNNHNRSSGEKYPTPTPRRKTTCSKSTITKPRITRNSAKTSEKTITTLNNKNTTSHNTTVPLTKSVSSETNKKPTASSGNTKETQDKTTVLPGKTTTTTGTSYNATKTKGDSKTAEDHTIGANRTKIAPDTTRSPVEKTMLTHAKITTAIAKTKEQPDKTITASKNNRTPEKTTEYPQQTISAPEKNARTPVKTTEQPKKDTSPPDKTTRAPVKTPELTTLAPEQPEKTISAPVKTTRAPVKTTGRLEKITGVHVKATKQSDKIISAPKKTTRCLSKPTKWPEKTTVATKTARYPVKVSGDKSIATTSPHLNKTEVTHQVPTGSFTFTTSTMKLSSIVSEAPGNESHSYESKDDSKGEMGENDSFPAWAVVIVVLLAVILLALLILIFLVSYFTRTRHALTQNTEDKDPEDTGSPNSYPVYLMEQQALGKGQIPFSQ